jgi:hypothetical protein
MMNPTRRTWLQGLLVSLASLPLLRWLKPASANTRSFEERYANPNDRPENYVLPMRRPHYEGDPNDRFVLVSGASIPCLYNTEPPLHIRAINVGDTYYDRGRAGFEALPSQWPAGHYPYSAKFDVRCKTEVGTIDELVAAYRRSLTIACNTVRGLERVYGPGSWQQAQQRLRDSGMDEYRELPLLLGYEPVAVAYDQARAASELATRAAMDQKTT